MKASIFHALGNPLTVENIAIYNPGHQHVLIRTEVAGLCHSDLHYGACRLPVLGRREGHYDGAHSDHRWCARVTCRR